MPQQDLPDLTRAYELLCTRGMYIPKGARQIEPLTGVEYRHPTKGRRPVTADIRMLSQSSRLYAEVALHESLGSHGLAVRAVGDVLSLLKERYDQGLVWGFSGFATGGFSYAAEARAMRALHGSLKNMGLEPSLISDGGVSEGVLGLSGVLAERSGIPSLGFLPRQGLASAGQRTHMVVRMHTYEGRERLVGTVPDVLVCVAGGGGTLNECEAALNQGSVVLLMAVRGYDPPSFVESHRDVRLLARAEDEANPRLFVCRGLQEVMSVASRAARAAGRTSKAHRPARLATLGRLLAA